MRISAVLKKISYSGNAHKTIPMKRLVCAFNLSTEKVKVIAISEICHAVDSKFIQVEMLSSTDRPKSRLQATWIQVLLCRSTNHF